MAQKIIPHLWFDTQGRQAVEFYSSIFPNASILSTTIIQGSPSGDVEIISFSLAGYEMMCMSAGPFFKINPSISFMLRFNADQDPNAEGALNKFWEQLSDGGVERMPIGAYPFSQRFGWIEDKFGVNWQLHLDPPGSPTRPFIIPCMLYVTEAGIAAEEATNLYLSLFQNAARGTTTRYPAGMEPNKEGALMFTEFTLAGEWFIAMDGPSAMHPFRFNEAVSFIVNCDGQTEIDHFWYALSAVPDAEACGWLKDKFGVSWQIVPADMERHMKGEPECVARANAAVMEMKKLDIAEIEKAYRGEK